MAQIGIICYRQTGQHHCESPTGRGFQDHVRSTCVHADANAGLISALVDYLRWDDAGPPVALLLLARAAGGWWDRLVRQQDLADSYTVLDLDRHPVPPADRAEHFRRASAAFAAYRGPQARQADAPPAAELEDPAYAEPLLIHIAALLRTVDTSATPPPGPGEERPPEQDSTTGQPGLPVRQALLKALCQRERDRWRRLGEESHLFFNPDLRVDDQVVALATLTAAADQPSATSLLAALPNRAEVTRIGAEALAAWAHRLYAGPGYWNPLRPDLLAEQHLADTADTAQLSHLATTAAELAAGQRWETRLLTQLLAELTRAAPNQPALRAALSELLARHCPGSSTWRSPLATPNWPTWPASRCSWHPSPAWPPRWPARCPSTACSSPRWPPPSPASKSPCTGRARSTENRMPPIASPDR